MSALLVLAAAVFAVWLSRGGAETVGRARGWLPAVLGGAVALFVIVDVVPRIGHG